MSAKKLVPYFLAGVGVGLCLLVIAAAGFVAYDRATRATPPESVAEDASAPETEDDKDADAEKDAEAEEGKEDPAADSATDSAPDPASSAEPSFVETARRELGVPDDPSITYQIGEPYYWEGVGITVTPIAFYQGNVIVASADCAEDGSPATTILGYPGMLS